MEKKLIELKYQKSTTSKYKNVWKKFKNYANENELFTEKLGIEFLQENYGEQTTDTIKSSYYRTQCAYRALKLLGDYLLIV